jgi:hypothetical protein
MLEKRRFPRFPAALMAFAVTEGAPMALDDISQTGLGMRYYGEEKLPPEIDVDLMFLDSERELAGVRCRLTVDRRLTTREARGLFGRHIGLEFIEPTGELLSELEKFIEGQC